MKKVTGLQEVVTFNIGVYCYIKLKTNGITQKLSSGNRFSKNRYFLSCLNSLYFFTAIFILGTFFTVKHFLPLKMKVLAQSSDVSVIVCHVPPGNPAASVVVEINIKEWETGHHAHKDHDMDFVVEDNRECENFARYTNPTLGREDHKILICHFPPGNLENPQVIEVDKYAWDTGTSSHSAHKSDFVVTDPGLCGNINPSITPTVNEQITVLPITPTPTITPTNSVTPTPTITPTNSVTPTPTPQATPVIAHQSIVSQIVQPTQTITITPSPTPSNVKSDPGETNEAGVLGVNTLPQTGIKRNIAFFILGLILSGISGKKLYYLRKAEIY